MNPRRPLVGPGEAAQRLGVTTRTVQRWLRQGRLPGVRVGGRIKVDADALPAPIAPQRRTAIRAIAIANRGEIVVRIARTCRELGIRSVALVAPDQNGAWWTEQADARVRLDGGAGAYLDVGAVVAAALASGAEALHPGYGFLAENPAFAEAVESAGLTWIGPPPEAVRLMGDKVAARRLAAHEGVPLLPGSDGRAQSDRALATAADRIGYPVLVKPVAGGGGKGMHVARVPADLREVLGRARREAATAFGDDRLLLERYLDRPRHVEIQVLFDRAGRGVHLGERECSLQRRHQKVLEESPSPALRSRAGASLRRAMGAAALQVAAAAGYVGAGTVEFLLDAERGDFFFLEMNTRLQVEHPVTELVTGRDLVADQVAVASGTALGQLTGDDARGRTLEGPSWGHAIEVRLYAEDAEQGFLPSGGRVAALRWPSGEGIRVDAGVGEGDEIGSRYDPLLAKIVVGGSDRPEAIERLRNALDATVVLGPVTNLRFLRWIVAADWFARGETFTDSIPPRWHPGAEAIPDVAWAAAARSLAGASGQPLAGWRLNAAARLRLRSGDEEHDVEVARERPPDADDFAVVREATRGEASAGEAPPGEALPVAHIDVAGRSVAFTLAPPPTVEAAVRHAGVSGSGSLAVTAPMPGRVIAVPAVEGAQVELHEPLVVLDAMKMENAVGASAAGTVAVVHVRPGQQVQKGDLLVEIAE
jgi:excisionase family DNA binding protein